MGYRYQFSSRCKKDISLLWPNHICCGLSKMLISLNSCVLPTEGVDSSWFITSQHVTRQSEVNIFSHMYHPPGVALNSFLSMTLLCSLGLIPRLLCGGGGKRAWYTLLVHALHFLAYYSATVKLQSILFTHWSPNYMVITPSETHTGGF